MFPVPKGFRVSGAAEKNRLFKKPPLSLLEQPAK
jgi:hypothetical protein